MSVSVSVWNQNASAMYLDNAHYTYLSTCLILRLSSLFSLLFMNENVKLFLYLAMSLVHESVQEHWNKIPEVNTKPWTFKYYNQMNNTVWTVHMIRINLKLFKYTYIHYRILGLSHLKMKIKMTISGPGEAFSGDLL